MAKRTKRGDEERKQEDEQVGTGEPAEAATTDNGRPPVNTTRDKGVKPAKDNIGDDDAAQPS